MISDGTTAQDQTNVQAVMSVLDNLSTPLSQMSRSIKQFHDDLDRGSRNSNQRFNEMGRQAFQAGQRIRETLNSALEATNRVAGLAVSGIAAVGYSVIQQSRHFKDLEFVSKQTGVSLKLLKEFEDKAETMNLQGGIGAIETMSQKFVDLGRHSREETAWWNTYFPSIAAKIVDLSEKFQQTQDPKYMLQGMELYFESLDKVSPSVQRIATEHLNMTTQSQALLAIWKEALEVYKKTGEFTAQDLEHVKKIADAYENIIGSFRHLRDAITLRVADSPFGQFMEQIAKELEDPKTFKIEIEPGSIADIVVNEFWKTFVSADGKSWTFNVDFALSETGKALMAFWDWVKRGIFRPESENPFVPKGPVQDPMKKSGAAAGQSTEVDKAVKDGTQEALHTEGPSLADKIGEAVKRAITPPGWARRAFRRGLGQIGGGAGTEDLHGGAGTDMLGEVEGFQRYGAGRYSMWGATPGDVGGGFGGGGGVAGSGTGSYGRGGSAMFRPGVGPGAGSGGPSGFQSVNTSPAMKTAMDQLRKEGVPESNLKYAAAMLTGQAISESGLNPNAVHDHGTGYGIYGAGRGRRTSMLNWMAENKFPANSLEGQMRYMAHEAMTGKGYGPSRAALMGATQDTLGAGTDTLTRNFEAPAIANVGRRYRDTLQALQSLDAPTSTSQGPVQPGSIRGAPGYNPELGSIDPRLRDIMSQSIAAFEEAHPGFTVAATSGRRYGKGQGPHASPSGALDFQIFGPNGALPNSGRGDPGLYGDLATTAYGTMLQKYPELQRKFNWGNWFETSRGSGRMDWMHYDFMGDQPYRQYSTEQFAKYYNQHSGSIPKVTGGAKVDVTVNNQHGTGDRVTPEGTFQSGKAIRMFAPRQMTDAAPFLPQ